MMSGPAYEAINASERHLRHELPSRGYFCSSIAAHDSHSFATNASIVMLAFEMHYQRCIINFADYSTSESENKIVDGKPNWESVDHLAPA